MEFLGHKELRNYVVGQNHMLQFCGFLLQDLQPQKSRSTN